MVQSSVKSGALNLLPTFILYTVYRSAAWHATFAESQEKPLLRRLFWKSLMLNHIICSSVSSLTFVSKVTERLAVEQNDGSAFEQYEPDFISQVCSSETTATVRQTYRIILAYKSLPRISRPPKKPVPVWSKIVDPRISRRWFLRTCIGKFMLYT